MNLWRLPLKSSDGVLSVDAIDSLYEAIAVASYDSRFDLDDDRKLGAGNVRHLFEDVLQTQFGDTKLDGVVVFKDFLQLSSSLGLASSSSSQGDFDGDRRTKFEDFLLLSKNFGFGGMP